MENKIIGFLTDLNIKDDAVGLCKGLMLSYNAQATIVDISHHVTPFDVEEGGQYLTDVPEHFPSGAIIVCVVFPETGTELDSIIVKNTKNQYLVAANNGLLTRCLKKSPAVETYKINKIELPQTMNKSFYGRDVIVKAGGLLSSGKALEDIGEKISNEEITLLELEEPKLINGTQIEAKIDIIDKNFGNVWTNLSFEKLCELKIEDGQVFNVKTKALNEQIEIPFLKSFGFTQKGSSLAYINSRGKMAFGINQGNFAEKYNVKRGDLFGLNIKEARH